MGRKLEFRWNFWNLSKIASHNLSSLEVEHVVRNAKAPYPRKHKAGTRLVRGKSQTGYYIQVIYATDDDGTLYVIHAMPIRKP